MWDTKILSNWQSGSAPVAMQSLTALKAHEKEVNCVRYVNQGDFSGFNLIFLSVAPNDRLIATASQDKTIKLWPIEKKSKTTSVNQSQPIVLSGHKRGVWSCCFSPVDKVRLGLDLME